MNTETDPIKEAAAMVVQHFGGPKAVATALGYDDIRNVAYWTSGKRPFPPKHCVAIERISKGQITRQLLRPDDFADYWPDLARRRKQSA